MFANSKSKGGSLKDVHVEDANISWAGGVYNNIEKLVFNEIKLYVLTIIIVYKCKSFLTNIYQLCVSIDYCVFSFIECKLTLISFTKTIVNASLFFQKNLF